MSFERRKPDPKKVDRLEQHMVNLKTERAMAERMRDIWESEGWRAIAEGFQSDLEQIDERLKNVAALTERQTVALVQQRNDCVSFLNIRKRYDGAVLDAQIAELETELAAERARGDGF